MKKVDLWGGTVYTYMCTFVLKLWFNLHPIETSCLCQANGIILEYNVYHVK